MEDTLGGLIAKIKSEGVEEARRQADEIIRKAQEEADGIIKKAKEEAEKIIAEADQKASLRQKNAKAAINQAARDVTLRLKEELTRLFEKALLRQIQETLDTDTVAQLIVELVRNWSPEKELEVTVPPEAKEKLEKLLLAKIKEEAKKGIVIKVDERLTKGFYIGIKEDNLYYDFSDESIFESLKVFLSPSLVSFMQDNDG